MASLSPFYFSCTCPTNKSGNQRSRFRPKIRLNASQEPTNPNGHPTDLKNKKVADGVDRRKALIGLGGVISGLSVMDDKALARPIVVDSLSQCVNKKGLGGDCCPEVGGNIITFRLPPAGAPLRTRPAAHLVTPAYVAKYERAVRLMKNLPASDPRNFMQQANVHCAYCDSYYNQVGLPDQEIQVHAGWLFLPWHRWYLYFHERILGQLIGDPNFALPFWNWDNRPGMSMPSMYANPRSPLYNYYRNMDNLPTKLVNLHNGYEEGYNPAEQVDVNLSVMHTTMISNAGPAELFMGQPYIQGGKQSPGAGSLEDLPHNAVHNWTGTPYKPFQDMGDFTTAGRDPIFHAHHSNVDRLWSVWKSRGGKEFQDSDWLNATFVFFDENSRPVRVNVKDSLDTNLLRYTYQPVNNAWVLPRATPATLKRQVEPDAGRRPEPTFPLVLQSAVTVTVPRPKVVEQGEVEVLVVDGIEFDSENRIAFDVYINTPERATAMAESEYCGGFVNVPHGATHSMNMVTTTKQKLGISDLIAELDGGDDKSLLVTLVPMSGEPKIGGIYIECLPL